MGVTVGSDRYGEVVASEGGLYVRDEAVGDEGSGAVTEVVGEGWE